MQRPAQRVISRSAAQKKTPRLVAVMSVMRHESVGNMPRTDVAQRFGIVPLKGGRYPPKHREQHLLGLDLPGEAKSLKQGERAADVLMHFASDLRKRGIVYTGIYSPLVRAIETGQFAQQGLSARLRDQNVRTLAHFSYTSPDLHIVGAPKHLSYYPKTQEEIDAVMKEFGAWTKGEPVKGWETRASFLKRARSLRRTKEIILRNIKNKTFGAREPVLFLGYFGHGGLPGIPGDIDAEAKALTGMSQQKLGGLIQRGENVMQLLFSDGSTKIVVLKKDKTIQY